MLLFFQKLLYWHGRSLPTYIPYDGKSAGAIVPTSATGSPQNSLIPNEPARTLSASSNSGEPHETQGCPQPPWRCGGVVAAGCACAAAGDASNRGPWHRERLHSFIPRWSERSWLR